MNKSLLGALLGLAVMAYLSLHLEGAVRAGAWAGLLLGIGVGCAIVGWQAGAFRKEPSRALETLTKGFLIKLVTLALMGLAVKLWEPLAVRLDWQAFLLAAAAGLFLLLVLGTVDNAAILRDSYRVQVGSAAGPMGTARTSPGSFVEDSVAPPAAPVEHFARSQSAVPVQAAVASNTVHRPSRPLETEG